MFEHINCHGEIQNLLVLVECLPFLRTWIQGLRFSPKR